MNIARALNDEANLGLYLNYCKKYPERIVVKAFITVRRTPDEKIKKSRGALFTYLVKQFVEQEKTGM